jgi:iron complex outermembrane receptor protein
MCTACSAAVAAEAQQATNETAVLEEIVVTAQRREERLQDVPLSITAFTATQLEQQSRTSIGDILELAPNVARSGGPSSTNDAYFFIRGVGQGDNSVAVDPGVGTYVDGVYLGRLQGASLDLLDIARVEILRGPQGTLFGRNTIGGAINVTTADPGPEFGGTARLWAGSRDLYGGQATLNLPVTDTLGLRVSGHLRSQDGWGRNVYTDEIFGSGRTAGGRAKLVWTPADDLKITIIGDYSDFDGTPSHQILTGFNAAAGRVVLPIPPQAPVPPGGTRLPGTQGVLFTGTTPLGIRLPAALGQDRSADRGANFSSVPAQNDSTGGGLSATVSYSWDWAEVKSITAWRRTTNTGFTDLDATGFVFYDSFVDTTQSQFSQELQFNGSAFDDRLTWVTGAYFFNEDIDNLVEICIGSNTGVNGVAVRNDGRCLLNRQGIDLSVQSRALFGQFNFTIVERLTLVGGLRWTSERKNQQFDAELDNTDGVASLLPFNNPPVSFGPIPRFGTVLPTVSPRNPALRVPTAYKKTWTDLSPRIGLNFELTQDVLLYASYSEGFKGGGWTGRPSGTGAVQPYDPETVRSYEAGFKAELFDRRLRFNGAVFQSDYNQIQLLVLNPLSGLFETGNAGNARIRGFELEAVAAPISGLTLNAGVGYLHNEYRSLNANVPAEIQLNDKLPLTPKWTINLGAQYRAELADLGSVTLRGDYSYRSSFSFQVGNDPLEIEDGYGLLNLRATFQTADERYGLSVYGLNVAGTDYLRSAQDSTADLGTAFGGPGAPAEWGVELRVRF